MHDIDFVNSSFDCCVCANLFVLLLCAWLKFDPTQMWEQNRNKNKTKQKRRKPGYGEGWEKRL
jgi:hypothetical protein